MLGVPTVGTHSWKRIQEETVTLVGPMTLERIITNQKQQIKYPCYRIRDTQSLKDKQIHDNAQFTLVQGYHDLDIDTVSTKGTDSMILVAHQSNQTTKTMYQTVRKSRNYWKKIGM